MSDVEQPSLREQLMAARAKVETQIDRLRARPYPFLDSGPLRTNGVMIDNSELIARLTRLLHRLDDALEELGPYD